MFKSLQWAAHESRLFEIPCQNVNKYRYYRIKGENGMDGEYMQLSQVQFFGPSSGKPPVCLKKIDISSTAFQLDSGGCDKWNHIGRDNTLVTSDARTYCSGDSYKMGYLFDGSNAADRPDLSGHNYWMTNIYGGGTMQVLVFDFPNTRKFTSLQIRPNAFPYDGRSDYNIHAFVRGEWQMLDSGGLWVEKTSGWVSTLGYMEKGDVIEHPLHVTTGKITLELKKFGTYGSVLEEVEFFCSNDNRRIMDLSCGGNSDCSICSSKIYEAADGTLVQFSSAASCAELSTIQRLFDGSYSGQSHTYKTNESESFFEAITSKNVSTLIFEFPEKRAVDYVRLRPLKNRSSYRAYVEVSGNWFPITRRWIAAKPDLYGTNLVQASCQAWFKNGARNSGLYMVDGYGKSSSFQVYCDMESDGGGWTLVSNFRQTSHNCQSGAVGTLTSPSQTSHGRLSDVQIQNLQGEGSGHFRYTRGSDNLKNFYRYRAGYGNRLFYSQKSHARGGMVAGNIHEVASSLNGPWYGGPSSDSVGHENHYGLDSWNTGYTGVYMIWCYNGKNYANGEQLSYDGALWVRGGNIHAYDDGPKSGVRRNESYNDFVFDHHVHFVTNKLKIELQYDGQKGVAFDEIEVYEEKFSSLNHRFDLYCPNYAGCNGDEDGKIYIAPYDGTRVSLSSPAMAGSDVNHFDIQHIFDNSILSDISSCRGEDKKFCYYMASVDGNQVIQFEFTERRTVDFLRLWPRTSSTSHTDYKIAVVEEKDTWKEIVNWVDTSGLALGGHFDHAVSKSITKIRLNLRPRGSSNRVSLDEIMIFGEEFVPSHEDDENLNWVDVTGGFVNTVGAEAGGTMKYNIERNIQHMRVTLDGTFDSILSMGAALAIAKFIQNHLILCPPVISMIWRVLLNARKNGVRNNYLARGSQKNLIRATCMRGPTLMGKCKTLSFTRVSYLTSEQMKKLRLLMK